MIRVDNPFVGPDGKRRSYRSGVSDSRAVFLWKTFAEQLRRNELERYEYWQVLDMRESFDDGQRTLTATQKAEVGGYDQIVRERLIDVLKKFDLEIEYHQFGKRDPKEYWWWHIGE